MLNIDNLAKNNKIMNKLYATIICGFLSLALCSQEKKEMTGPAYKNQLPWKSKAKAVKLYTVSTTQATGPKAKNAAPGVPKNAELTAVVFTKPKKQETGPKYKNRKPGVL